MRMFVDRWIISQRQHVHAYLPVIQYRWWNLKVVGPISKSLPGQKPLHLDLCISDTRVRWDTGQFKWSSLVHSYNRVAWWQNRGCTGGRINQTHGDIQGWGGWDAVILQIAHLRDECQLCMMRNKKFVVSINIWHLRISVVQPTNFAVWWNKMTVLNILGSLESLIDQCFMA
jgi:hypothetical protein